jgi:hypothetical protein
MAHPDGRPRFMVASHGFPQGGAVMHQYDERRVGNLKEVFSGSDIALAEVQEGVSFDTSDYFGIPLRPAEWRLFRISNSVTTLPRTVGASGVWNSSSRGSTRSSDQKTTIES